MNNSILLSILIPTKDRAQCLEKLLNCLLPQAEPMKEEVQICISDNDSSDSTAEVVTKFQKKYFDLINYNRNRENIGADRNMLKLIEMSEGEFVWLLGDDDLVEEGGINKIVNFIKASDKRSVGLIVLGVESYLIDKSTGKKIVFNNSVNTGKPEIFEIEKKEIIGLTFPNIAFISALIFNSWPLKEILAKDALLVKEATHTKHIQAILAALIFLKNPGLAGIAFNKAIINQEMPQYKYFIEDKFTLHYQLQREINRLLLSSKYMNNNYAPLIIQREKELKWCFIADMLVMKAFKSFNYFSYSGCLKLFFKYAAFLDMLLFFLVFSGLFMVPSAVLTFFYKGLLIVKHGKKWKEKWNFTRDVFCWLSGGVIRR